MVQICCLFSEFTQYQIICLFQCFTKEDQHETQASITQQGNLHISAKQKSHDQLKAVFQSSNKVSSVRFMDFLMIHGCSRQEQKNFSAVHGERLVNIEHKVQVLQYVSQPKKISTGSHKANNFIIVYRLVVCGERKSRAHITYSVMQHTY